MVTMLATKQDRKENKFQSALQYVGEYRGVKGAAILDCHGLVVGYHGEVNFDACTFSPLILLMLDNVNAVLKKLKEKAAQMVVVKTADSWITIKQAGDLTLVVLADGETDELLKVRIGQAVDMIKAHLQQNYPLATK